MQRYLWESGFTKNSCPPWLCTKCKKGVLRLQLDSFSFEETANSQRWHNAEDWGPEHIEFTFIAWAGCSDEGCKERYALSGIGGIESEYTGDEDGSTEWVNYFTPKFVYPALSMIDIPAKCPKSVRSILQDAFACYWSQPDACAGRIRAALEALLTHFGVPSEAKKSDGSSFPLSLQKRLDIFSKTSPAAAAQLTAIKWLGNSGAHGQRVTKADILDALELLEHVLVELIDQKSAKLAELAKNLLAKHAPGAA
jgi:hypothetical protein